MKLILKKHRNALYGLISRVGLDPQLFSLTEQPTEQGESLRLELSGTPLYFEVTAILSGTERLFRYRYATFKLAYPEPVISSLEKKAWGSFETIEYGVLDWLPLHVGNYRKYMAEVEEERVTPDLWSGLNSQPSPPSALSALQNTPFSQQEQARINDALHEFFDEVKSRAILTPDQLNLLQEQVNYLVEASKRVGRKDWLTMTAGALIGYTLQAGLTTETATQVIRLAGEAIQWIARTPLLLL